MFLSEAATLDVPLAMAKHRLLTFLSAGDPDGIASAAFNEGATMLTRAGAAGLSKTVRVEIVPAYQRGEVTVIPIRWTATGPLGSAFPVLDANIELTGAGSQTLLEVLGSYRPPLGRVGEALDQLLLKSVARATIQKYLSQLSHIATDVMAAPSSEGFGMRFPEPEEA